ncbi:hypothetical protein [Succinivibrio dextrinosolvens]|uniref:hypothetical protein n=1 Tax=Succinivibrio dextrinosolvens TaxID=83771 RepID=UPI00241BFA9A|nr:hypothetical protein [Succinivibrio dextrinosolvens]MBE6422682.1 hypothetical protein [Succinivibrio dextrinosolvens]
MQYIMKSMLKHITTVLIVITVCVGGYTFAQHENLISDSNVKVEGVSDDFTHNHIRPDAPNSVKGVKKVAKEGDYVLLRGVFVRRADAGIYEFHDDAGDGLFVDLGKSFVLNERFFNTSEFFIWGTVKDNNKSTTIEAISMSAKSFPVTSRIP